ncbi:MAG: hypothetical protein Q9212_006508 [Teloschistes hypoglaucus]
MATQSRRRDRPAPISPPRDIPLHPVIPGRWGQDIPIGSLELTVPNMIKNATSILSSLAQFAKEPAISASFSAPFPVPDTDIYLDPGPRGEDLNFAQTITSLNGLLNNAWAEVAIHGTARAVNRARAYTDSANGVLCVLNPRKVGGVSFVSTTDLAEAVTGIVNRISMPRESNKFLPTLLDVKFRCKAFESLKIPEDLRESAVLEITIKNEQPHELPGADMSYSFLVDDIEMFVHLLRTADGSESWTLWLDFHAEHDHQERTGQAKAVEAFGQIRRMPNVHVRRSDPITIGQDLSSKMAQNVTWFSEGVEHVKALRTRANLHCEVRAKSYVSRLDHWEAAKAVYSQAMSLLDKYDNRLRHRDTFDDEPDDSELYREQILMLLAETAQHKARQPNSWVFKREKIEALRAEVLGAITKYNSPGHGNAVAHMHLCALSLLLGDTRTAGREMMAFAPILGEQWQARKMRFQWGRLVKEQEKLKAGTSASEPPHTIEGVDLDMLV